MCRGALACSASPSHALALRTAVKGSRPLASSAAIADASVQPAYRQVTDPSAMVSSEACMHCVAAMLPGQICCRHSVSTLQKKYRRTTHKLEHMCICVCMCLDVGWIVASLSLTSSIQSHCGKHAGTYRQTQTQTYTHRRVSVICAPAVLSRVTSGSTCCSNISGKLTVHPVASAHDNLMHML